jgi:precorrin-6B C5,15-methyltransferase / cobalt-precorrin-6B C5,C15-methyltransferase
MAKIAVVGIGLDGVSSLRETAEKIIGRATVLGGSSRHLSYFPEYGGVKICFDNFQQGIEAIKQLLTPENFIVILASGDPLFFGLGRLLLAKFDAENITFYPHVSSVQLAFSRLKIPWQDAELTSVHGRNTDELIKLFKQGKDKIAILTDKVNHPGAIARMYLALELPVEYDFYICKNLGGEDEKIDHFTIEKIAELANLNSVSFDSLNVLVLLRQRRENKLDLNSLPLMGIPDNLFASFPDRPGLITKKEIRTAILTELALQPQQIIWDIGAGTGSVAIEIARLCLESEIYAIEKTSIGASLIAQNCEKFQTNNIKIICGKAPQSLLELPLAHRIFIGGSGGNLIDILETCTQNILPQGKIVLALATIEHYHSAIAYFSANSWKYSLLQLQISRSIPIKNLTRLTPLNPVTIVTASLDN